MEDNLQRFAGKTVIVTGSSSGIGKGIAKRFASEGANVVLNSRSREDLEKVAAGLDKDRTLIVEGDVGGTDFARSIVDRTLDRFGALDVLVNNAGIATPGPLAEAQDDDIDAIFEINVKGLIRMCRAAIPHLVESGGSIVNTSSVSGLGGDWTMPLYCASKGAVSNFTRALALQLGEQGVRVNAVCPSMTRSEMTDGMTDNEELMTAFNRRMPLGAPGEPEDVAAVVAFLASKDARHVTGVNLPVDGGVNASNGQPNFGAFK
ncbi:MAG: SDR family oxidoreductase [Erythrobacter sp.]|nr:SDR family oxidoreductase [Erythrobacter sp.]